MIAGRQILSVLPKCEKSLYFKGFRRFFDKGCVCVIAASAAKSSLRSVRISPLTPTYFISNGTPDAAVGYAPVVWSTKYAANGVPSICSSVRFFVS